MEQLLRAVCRREHNRISLAYAAAPATSGISEPTMLQRIATGHALALAILAGTLSAASIPAIAQPPALTRSDAGPRFRPDGPDADAYSRYAQPGQRFSYSSADSIVLGLVLAGATRRTVSDYASEKLWIPLGAEADASWAIDANGQEITFAYINAVLRDWARLGLMLAHDGTWQGRSIVPKTWLLASTSIEPGSPFWSNSLKPGAHSPGYGYQVWLLMADRRTFALRGLRGQYVIVDPETKLVLVQTAVRAGSGGEPEQELYALWSALSSQLR
jgi:CubicO group peptidase (beta-lactamase class C family)